MALGISGKDVLKKLPSRFERLVFSCSAAPRPAETVYPEFKKRNTNVCLQRVSLLSLKIWSILKMFHTRNMWLKKTYLEHTEYYKRIMKAN